MADLLMILTHVGSALGGGLGLKLLEKRVASVDAEADRVAKRRVEEETARDDFRKELREEIAEVRRLHDKCQEYRSKEHDECVAAHQLDAEERADLRRQVATLRDLLDTLKPGAPHVRERKTSKRKKAKARGPASANG